MSNADSKTKMDSMLTLFGLNFRNPPDEIERAFLSPSLRNLVESRVKVLREIRERLEAMIQASPEDLDDARSGLNELSELRRKEFDLTFSVQRMLDGLKANDFDMTGWDINVPPLSITVITVPLFDPTDVVR